MEVIDIPSASVAASIVQIDEYAVGREQSTADSLNDGDRIKMSLASERFLNTCGCKHICTHVRRRISVEYCSVPYNAREIAWKRQFPSPVVDFGTPCVEVTRQFGTKTFQHPLKKTVRYQDKSVPGQIGTAFSFKQT